MPRLSKATAQTLAQPEFRTVLACCRWPDADERRAAIAEAAKGVADWELVWRIAKRHRVRGLVHHGLRAVDASVPREVLDLFGDAARRLTIDNLRMAAETARISQSLDRAGIPHMMFKGATLAELAYQSQSIKEGRDIDLLVGDDRLVEALKVLEGDGYALAFPSTSLDERQFDYVRRFLKDVSLFRRSDAMLVELHWRLKDNRFLMADLGPSKSLSQSVTIAGVAVPTFAPADLGVYLAVHGAIECWPRLKWLADFNAIAAADGAAGFADVHRRAIDLGLEQASGEAILLCHHAFGARLPSALERLIDVGSRFDKGVRLSIDTLTGRRDEDDERTAPTRPWRVALIETRLSRGLRAKLAGLRWVLLGSLDGVELPLPPQLYFLFPFARLPLWIARQIRRLRAAA